MKVASEGVLTAIMRMLEGDSDEVKIAAANAVAALTAHSTTALERMAKAAGVSSVDVVEKVRGSCEQLGAADGGERGGQQWYTGWGGGPPNDGAAGAGARWLGGWCIARWTCYRDGAWQLMHAC